MFLLDVGDGPVVSIDFDSLDLTGSTSVREDAEDCGTH
jgi:hypothetical protein